MEKIINLSFTKEHPIIGNHTVYGNSVLPGLAYIDLLYQLAREVIGIEYYTHSLNHLTIYNPMLIDEKSSVHLKVVFKQSNHHWKVKITGVENGLEANEGILKTYIKAEFHPKHVSVEGQKDLFHLKNNTNKVVDLNEVYNSAQKKGLVHQGIIKARGKVYITDQNCLVEVKMDDEFLVEAEGFIFSPTLLDGAAMAWGEIESRIGSNDNTDLFLPLYFESFSCSKALKTNCYAIIEHSSLSQANDILTMDMELYNSKGIKVGTLKKMTAKKVRDINHFTTDSDVENHTPDFGFNEIANDETEIGCEGIIRKVLSKYMDELAYQIELDAGFFESGLESQQLLRLVNDLEDTLQLSLSPTLLFEYSNLKELVGYLDNLLDCRVLEMMQKKDEEEPISAKPRSIMNQYMFYGNERFLHDHLVYGQPALMGVTHPCLAIESLLAQSEISWPLELRNIIFQGGPVTLEDNETATVKVEFEEKNNRATFKTHFFVDNPANLKTCCSGEYIGAINESVERLNIKGLIEQSKPLNNDAVIRWYEAFNNFKIGPMLEVIKSAYQYDKLTTISHACLEWKEKKGDQVDFSFDPLLLNACFLMNNDLKFETKDSIYVPFTIEKIKIYNKLSNNVYIIKKSRFEKPDFHSFDALITNQDGVILAEIINASLKEATNPQKLENASFPLSSLQIKREKMEVEQGAEMPLDIAIVGVSGRYPMAYDIEDFWLKLASGKNCISEIPKERWNWEGLFTSDLSEVGRIHSKWGGFIEDVDRFDSRFFNISQREAELMDPQERLYLEHCWMALEDAGYTKEMLGSDSAIRSQVGVYVGVMHHEYPLLAAESTIDGNRIGIGGAASSIATRVSYFFDFSGPSMVVDTMCSSSMSAVYLACQALKGKQIDAALIGGVNLSLHPSKYLMLSQRHFISPKGRCASFGEDGDGYIPGEGVGVLFLKRLEDAIRDKDHIYAVIKGAAINHGGRSGGYTVPNIKSQSDVISKAIVESQIDPKSITYIEAHGTGTKLGDPIEIQGLKNAFEEFTDQKQYCWIGSVKSNIGHCEAAAGVAGITKVLNQMRYGKIAPTLHSRVVNPEINLADTPFMLNHELRNWERPVIEGEVQPRRAGISSFGAGGTNTHLIIEEYMKHVPEQPNSSVQMKPVIIVLSAKSKWSLKKNAEKLVDAIHRDKFSNLDLVDMAYTLQIGRNAMKYRLAIIVESLEKLKEKLQSFINGHQEIPDLFIGKIERMIDKELTINYLIDSYDKICEYWVSGNNVKWENLYNGLTPNRISLPTYSFERVLCWIPNESNTSSTIQPTIIHPLLNSNNLNFMEQRFTSALTGQEFFLLDHRINGQKVLPGAVYIEMVRAAVAYSTCITGNQRIELKKIIWKHPLVVNDQPERVSLSLYPEQEGGIRFEVNQESDNQTNQVLAQGQAILMEDHLSPAMDMEEIKKECSKQKVVSADEYYKAFKEIGIEYGPSFQGITTVWLGNNMALAELKLPVNDSSVTNAYYLHPSMLDAAFQTLFSMINSSGTPKPSVPFLLQNIRIFRETASMKWAYIRYSEGSSEEDKMRKFDIDLLDDEGNVGVQIRGISTRELEDRIKKEELQQSSETLLLQPVWIEHNVTEHEENIIYDRQIVLLSQELESVVGDMQAEIPHADCRVLKASSINVEERFTAYAEETFEIIKSIARENSREKILLQFVFSNAEKLAAGLSGLLKTAQLENPSLTAQLIEVDRKESMTEVVKENRNSVENQVRYQDGIRYVSRLNEISAEEDQGAIPWKDNGVYVITGGTGGLGLIFAKEIARKVKKPVLILSSRTPNKASVRERIKELEENGAKVVLKETDISVESQVTELIRGVREEYGCINGIIHCAGVIRDNYIKKKSVEELGEVFAPKVRGVAYLDQASKEEALDFFILFSSGSGVLGNPGQADYAAANAYMDVYTEHRNELIAKEQRQGRTLTINWPLWKEGGMQVSKATEKLMQGKGLEVLDTIKGLHAFYQAWVSNCSQVVIVEGDALELRRQLLIQGEGNTGNEEQMHDKTEETEDVDNRMLENKVQKATAQIVSKILKISIDHIDSDTELSDFGFDSITLTELADSINNEFELALDPTVFFKYTTIKEFSAYTIREYKEIMMRTFSISEEAKIASKPKDEFLSKPMEKNHLYLNEEVSSDDEPIAIVGISGKFPMADDVEEFWENLMEGKDCISEIPIERWDWKAYNGNPKSEKNKTNIKWGGFINGIDEFDPLFFGISPREAELMDPQQRLLLTYAWKVMEDAGYSAKNLSGTNTGVFIGTARSGYESFLTHKNSAIEGFSATGMTPSIGPNRLSYFLNIHGPSEAIETACSSSLVAIHRAVSSIKDRSCEMAIVGGINTIISPQVHISFNKAGMLSEDGRCKTFSDKANGYVRSEAVGMLFLKKLKDAERDGNQIYGVILSSSVNHGGRSNSLSAPNPAAQAELLKNVYRKANVNPSTITYIETHGTGTELGDPIEINSLKAAFQDLFAGYESQINENAQCGLGSVKTNVGHSELAAGVVGAIKVLLQLKYKTIVKSLHCETMNPYIQLQGTHFYINKETKKWDRLMDRDGKEIPCRAGISSFGFGGVNAHIVIEEYIPKIAVPLSDVHAAQIPKVILMSAKSEDRLCEQAKHLLKWIQEGRFSEDDLASIAYTLQVGREAMDERLGFMVKNLKELEKRLIDIMEGRFYDIYRDEVKKNKAFSTLFKDDRDLNNVIKLWLNDQKYDNLLNLWVKGVAIDWERLYQNKHHQIISLPSYPFYKDRYWLSVNEDQSQTIVHESHQLSTIHPLLHSNNSNFMEQRFTSAFTGQEFFLLDHRINGQMVLPGAVYIEMVRAAVAYSACITGNQRIELKKIIWKHPLVVNDQPERVSLSLYPEQEGGIRFEVNQESDNQTNQVLAQGQAILMEDHLSPAMDMEEIKKECSKQKVVSADEYYKAFKEIGIEYGPSFQGITTVWLGNNMALAELKLPVNDSSVTNAYYLHPSMLDAAFQTLFSMINSSGTPKPSVPFLLQNIRIFRETASMKWAYIRYSKGSSEEDKMGKFDIDLLDDEGNVGVQIRGISTRELEDRIKKEELQQSSETLLLQPVWIEHNVTEHEENIIYDRQIVLLSQELESVKGDMQAEIPHADCRVLKASSINVEERFTAYAEETLEIIKSIARENSREKILLQFVFSNAEKLAAGLSGLLKTAQLENPSLTAQLIEVDRKESMTEVVKENRNSVENQVRYQDGIRYVSRLNEISAEEDQGAIPWKDNGVYVITGGTGGLGLIFAKEITRKVKKPVLILSSRTPNKASVRERIKELEENGAKVVLKETDISVESQVTELIRGVREEYGCINGIIHCAGVIRDNYIKKKSVEELGEVFAPKVRGVAYLDQASKEEALDFFILFSSGSGVLGNPGQADYAAANAYMDVYTEHRNELIAKEQRQGRTLTINWPLWKEGGMQVSKATEKLMQGKGLEVLDTIKGLHAFYQAWVSNCSQVVIVEGDALELRRQLLIQGEGNTGNEEQMHDKTEETEDVDNRMLENKVQKATVQIVSKILKISIDHIDSDTELSDFGFDSITLTELADSINNEFELALDPTVFFKYTTIKEFSAYTIREYKEIMMRTFSVSEEAKIASKPKDEFLSKPMEKNHQYSKPLFIEKNWNQPQPTFATHVESDKKPYVKTDKVAIIGMHCNFPDAPDLKQYWNNLISGKDSVREVPSFRWDWRKHYKKNYSEGYSISKWGAFVDNIEYFDPDFFNIPNSLASTIDPLQRQWLEVSVQALSDAGYFNDLWGKKVGVFVGTRPSQFLNKTGFNDKDILVGTSQNFIGAHLAHIFNFKGPNLVVDTACSSSLTAIHLAVKSIQDGESELALAGGVDLLLDEKEFLVLSNSKILSPSGRCKTFDASADGIALGEGCGVLVLKSLTKAIEDHDKIYGVIEGTAINNDGNTMGITTPDPESQCNLIEEAILNAAINPKTISYIEAHGTGTLIGDPIELKGLTKAYRKYTDLKQFCGVGSVKSNIGHLLSASGAASIIKVLLAIIHKELPPILHCEKPNERFKFAQSPFYLVQHPQKWTTDSNVLRAGISSFGLGGSNAHIIISNEGIPESHIATLEPKNKRIEFNRSYYWPDNEKRIEAKDTEPPINDEDEFIHYFTISKLEDGRMNS